MIASVAASRCAVINRKLSRSINSEIAGAQLGSSFLCFFAPGSAVTLTGRSLVIGSVKAVVVRLRVERGR